MQFLYRTGCGDFLRHPVRSTIFFSALMILFYAIHIPICGTVFLVYALIFAAIWLVRFSRTSQTVAQSKEQGQQAPPLVMQPPTQTTRGSEPMFAPPPKGAGSTGFSRLPSDIIGMMERFGQYEFNPQASEVDPADMGRLIAEVYSYSKADPDGFLIALAEAVLPVGGWAVYGASRTIWECFGSEVIISCQHPAVNAIMDAAIEFLRANRVSPMNVRGYEWEYWLAKDGTRDTWLPQPSTASQMITNPAHFSDSAEEWEKEGLAHIQSGRDAEAVAAFNQAIQLNPAYARYYVGRSYALNNLGRYQEALSSLDQAIQLDPTDELAYTCRGEALDKMNRYEEALVNYDRLLQINPTNAVASTKKGNILNNLGRHQEALAAFDQAIHFDPGTGEAYFGKGTVLAILKRYEEALAAYDRALSLIPDDINIWNNKATTLRNLGRPQEALTTCDHALILDSNNARVWNNKGNILNDLGRYQEALTAIDRSLTLNPNNVITWYNKSKVLKNLGRLKEAEAAARRAKELGG